MSADDIMPATRALAAGTVTEVCTCSGKGDWRTGHWPGCERGDAIRAFLDHNSTTGDTQ